MPLSAIGKKVLRRMTKTYGRKKARQVFEAMAAEGKLTPKAFVKKKRRT